jgi:two-component system, NtrC family, nitrogen regulation sensor histidine kinase NtrY
MKDGKLKITPVIIAAILVLLAMAAEQIYLGDLEFKFRTKRFNRILKEKEEVMVNCLNGMKPILASGEPHGSPTENNLFSVAKQNGITILEYIGGRLVSWSDTDFDVPRTLSDSIYLKPIVFLQNGWFLTGSVQAGTERIVGLLRIRSDYSLQNDVIKSGFVKHFRIPDNTGLSRDPEASDYHVLSGKGTFLFSILYQEEKRITNLIQIPLIFWGLAFLGILYLTLCVVRNLTDRKMEIQAFISAFLIFSAIYSIVLIAKKPSVLFQTELFSHYRYTLNSFVPSLGHLLILTILLSVLTSFLYRILKTSKRFQGPDRTKWFILSLFFIPGALLFSLYHLIFSHLVSNSNINFETYKVLDLDIFSLTGFVILLMLFSIPFLYMQVVFQTKKQPGAIVVILSALAGLIVFPLFFLKDPFALVSAALFYFTVSVLVWLLKTRNTGLFNKTVIFSVVLGLYSLLLITCFSAKRTKENIKIQLVTYSTENDPMAEHLLLDMWPQISGDSILRRIMDVPVFEKNDVDSISDYLHKKYFNGYWGNFNLSVVPCSQDDSLSIGTQNTVFEDCYSFFGRKILASGHQLTGTGFYFIDSKQGRSSYMGRIYYEYGNSRNNALFIDLYSDIKVFQPGYSELLLDRKYHSYAKLKDYSFAKYINGELVLRTGDVPYNSTDGDYIRDVRDYRFFKSDSYNHSLYINGNVTVVISRPALTFQDIIISFAYIFAFIFIFSNLVLLLNRKPFFKAPSGLNFRQKMQLFFISILLISFTLIGFVTASLTIQQYRAKHYENLREKMNSIYMELENKISSAKTLTSDWTNTTYSSLEEVLVRLSNIFNTDINLYDIHGFLIASSRPEIYYRNLISKRMDNIAFINLFSLKKSEYLQKEKIANLEYVSAYVPYYNTDYDLIAYLNLPYFRMQSVLAREISNTIVAVVNFTLLLIVIAMSLAVFISGRLTAPLALLSSRLASVELGKKSEHLSYDSSDEVGELVRQYNRMVDELDESAQKLANSEREYAWREMAKQIAHEIKNPLTPMKLNIQQLFKSWTDGVPGFEKKLERFTKNQIEYIDNLSSIASAFSTFAKIPEANPVEVDLLEQIKTTLELFKNSDNVTFRVGSPHTEKILIRADKEQINGLFSNLIKNAIQSITPGLEGLIKVNLEKEGSKVIVSVSDNGSGIPESLKQKMFTPNFTTKSSGTGLGLSIVKRYVENAGGKIWFESEADKGTTFFIEFPLPESYEK